MARRSYLELIQLPTFEERFKYCQCFGKASEVTFGGHRMLNQILYRSTEWKRVKQQVIIRDNGCDLGVEDRIIRTKIIVHHLNPITIDEVMRHNPCVYDLNNLIAVSAETHNAIHYGTLDRLTPSQPTERTQGDTKLW